MPNRCTTRIILTTAAAATSLVAAAVVPAVATASTPRVVTLSTEVIAPFQLTVSMGQLFVGDGGTSLASKVTSNGLQTVARGPQPGEVTGVARNGANEFAYTSTNYATGQTYLKVKRPGRSTLAVNLSAFEAGHNPDKAIRYGIDNPTPCQVKALKPTGVPASYRGMVDSHPYAVASLGNGNWAVADAAGNDLLRVDRRGNISVIKVLPRQPATITAAAAKAHHLRRCVVGAVYNFEPVPTDVEVGPNGALYVTTLPGGPEDPSLGARGSVYRIDASTGHYKRLATGFAGATNLAVTSTGTVYVAEFFAGRISKLVGNAAMPYLSLPAVVSVTAGNGHLYAGTLAPIDDQGRPTGYGSIVQIH